MSDGPSRAAIIAAYQKVFSGRIMRFAAVGGIVTVFFMGLNAVFGRVVGLGPLAAFFISYPPALALHFLLNKLWTFGDRTATSHRQVGEYFFSVVVTFLIQWPSFIVLQRMAGLPGWVAAGGANLLQMSASYALLRWKVFHAASSAPSSTSNPWHRLALLLALAGGILLIFWTAFGSWELPRFGQPGEDYYNRLVSGFRKGSLAMDVPVPDALKNAPNPWDPQRRPAGIALHDASYFNGRYYLYFGVVPAVVLFWPFRVLTGTDLPLVVASFLHIVFAFLASAWLWLRILRDRFPRASLLTKLAGPLALGLCAGQLTLARRTSIWEMPIAAGHFYLVMMAVSAYLALKGRRPLIALAGAGLSLGLAIGCRPTLGAAGPGLAVLVIAVAWRMEGTSRMWGFSRSLLSAGLPFAAIMGGLLAYNWARFGNPLEFGLNYQLTGVYEAKATHFSSAFVPYNLEVYFLKPPQWGRYFPFIHPIDWVSQPANYYGIEFVYGALVVFPVMWWAGLLPWVIRRGDGLLVAYFGTVAIGTTLFLCAFNTATARYVPDFLPWWAWLGLLGWALLEDFIAAGGRARIMERACKALFGGTVIACLGFTFLQSTSLHGVYANGHPKAYVQIERIFDEPAAAWERLHHERLGPVDMDVVFPVNKVGILEPLLVSGVAYQTDYFFVYYAPGGVIRLGYASSGDAPLFSSDIPLESGRVYHLHFEGGALYPPLGHPMYSGWTEREIRSAKDWVRVSVDGQLVISQIRKSNDGDPGMLQVGRDDRGGAFGRRFTGTMSNFRREALSPRDDTPAGRGDIVLSVTIPDEIVPASQPLVVAGPVGSAELVGLRLIDRDRFVLTYEKWGDGYWESDPIAVPEGRKGTFRIRLGSLLPRSGPFPQGLFNKLLIVWLNGQPVWWRSAIAELGPNPDVAILANLIGSSAMRSSFMGRLLSSGVEPIQDWKQVPFDALEFDLSGCGTGIEPIVVTGAPGRADLLAIEWLPNNRARLLLDHWSHAAYSSREFPWNPERMHHLKLRHPAFSALDKPGLDTGSGIMTADVDGQRVWQEEVPFYGAASGTATFGRNTVGSSLAKPTLGGVLGDLRQDRVPK